MLTCCPIEAQDGRIDACLDALLNLQSRHSFDIQLRHNIAVATYVKGKKKDTLGLLRSLVHVSRCCSALCVCEDSILSQASSSSAATPVDADFPYVVDVGDTVAMPDWAPSSHSRRAASTVSDASTLVSACDTSAPFHEAHS